MAKRYAITEERRCIVCDQTVHVVTSRNAIGIFDPLDLVTPHRCPVEAVINLRNVFRRARAVLRRAGIEG